jgi:hypothetical protein
MATSKLMEAAADILAGSKSKAGADPMQKMPGAEYEDLGGPTPQNSKPDDDSNKIHASGKAPDNSAKNKASISTKPSAASADTQLRMNKEEEETEEEIIAEKMHDDEKKEMMKKKMKEDIDALFADDSTISEEFKSKAATIFEARVQDRVMQIEEEIEGKYASMLEEAIDSIKSDLTEKVDDYLNYVVEQWLADNEIAIESGLRAELTEEFIAGLRNLFAEHYIDVPVEKVDLVDELAGKVEELESKLNEEIERGISYAKALVESRKNDITREVCEGLTTTQAEKVKSLAESVEFSTEDEYTNKIETIRENYFPSGIKKADEQHLHEKVEDAESGETKVTDPFVAAVSQAISKTKL